MNFLNAMGTVGGIVVIVVLTGFAALWILAKFNGMP